MLIGRGSEACAVDARKCRRLSCTNGPITTLTRWYARARDAATNGCWKDQSMGSRELVRESSTRSMRDCSACSVCPAKISMVRVKSKMSCMRMRSDRPSTDAGI
jgi:hypothetical protein